MKKKSENIVSYTDVELRAMRARGEDKTDMKKAKSVPLPDGSDPDDAMDDDWMIVDLPLRRRKSHVTMRIDTDMLDWFRAQGKGYQTTINAILRKYYERKAG